MSHLFFALIIFVDSVEQHNSISPQFDAGQRNRSISIAIGSVSQKFNFLIGIEKRGLNFKQLCCCFVVHIELHGSQKLGCRIVAVAVYVLMVVH